MNKLLRFFLLQVCVCVFATVPLYAQSPEEIKFYRDAFATVANNYRTAIRQHLPMRDRQILDRIRFKFSPSQEFFAVAYIDDREQRVIEVSFGFLVLMENITFAYAVSGEASDEECFWHYLDAAGQALLKNTRRRLSGSKQRDLVPFFHHYVQEDGFGCELISVRDLRNPAARDFIPGGMDSVLAILVGHEVGHHLLGHLDRGAARTLHQSRRFENAADIWAVEHAFSVGINPFPAIPLWAFFSIIGGTDIGAEVESSHPLGIKRWAGAVDKIIGKMQTEEYERKFGSIPEDEWDGVFLVRDRVFRALGLLGLNH